MKIFNTIVLFLFCFTLSHAQTIDVSEFKKTTEKKSISEHREDQKGIVVTINTSFAPGTGGLDIKAFYTDESLFGLGLYFGIGQTHTFTVTKYDGDWAEWETYQSSFDIETGDYTPSPYLSLGLSKNLSNIHTVYVGYSRLFTSDPFPELPFQGFEEQNIIDLGYVLKSRKLSFTLGLPLHLPYYKIDDGLGIKVRPQIGIGYII